MATLTSADIVTIWEAGAQMPGWARALTLLAPACPGTDPAALTIGARNAALLSLRRDTIGPVMQVVVTCPACGEPLEFGQEIEELIDRHAPAAAGDVALTADDIDLRYHLPTSDDLRQAAGQTDAPAARAALIARVVTDARRDGAAIDPAALPEHVIALVEVDIAARDPLAQITISLGCAACQHIWPAAFDIVAFLWTEIDRQARRILEDIVLLARSYGWGEADILAMAPARRQYYLDAIG